MIRFYCTALLIIGSSVLLSAQKTVGLQTIIEATLQNNYNIQLAKKDALIAKEQATIGNAGYLPTVDVGATYGYSNNQTKTEFANNIPTIDNPSAVSQNYNVGLNIDYIIFDGLKPKYTLKQYRLQASSLAISQAQQVEVTVYNIGLLYYQLLGLQNNITVAEEKLKLTRTQLKRMEVQRKYGQGDEATWLNLKTSYNMDSTQVLQLYQTFEQAKLELNKLIGKDFLTANTLLEKEIQAQKLISLSDFEAAAFQQNKTIQLAKLQRVQAGNSMHLLKTELAPKLSTRLSYGISGQLNDAGIVQSNRTLGPTATLSLKYYIFSGGRMKPAFQKAKIDIERADLQLASLRHETKQSLAIAYQQYRYNEGILPMEDQNIALSKQSLQRIQKSFELGQSSFLDFQQAQLNVARAQQQRYQATLNVNSSLWDLYYLSGQLIK